MLMVSVDDVLDILNYEYKWLLFHTKRTHYDIDMAFETIKGKMRERAIEVSKENELRVGDEVRATGFRGLGVVTKIENSKVTVMYNDGSGGKWDVTDVTKTGRRSDVIAATLKELRVNGNDD